MAPDESLPDRPEDADFELAPEPEIDVLAGPSPAGFEVTISQGPSPIPPAAELERLAAIQDDLPDRIMSMVEVEASHRRQIEHQTLEAQIADARRDRTEAFIGQIIGAMVALLGLVVALVAAIHDAQWAASIIGGGTLASLATAFVHGRSRQKEEERSKPEE